RSEHVGSTHGPEDSGKTALRDARRSQHCKEENGTPQRADSSFRNDLPCCGRDLGNVLRSKALVDRQKDQIVVEKIRVFIPLPRNTAVAYSIPGNRWNATPSQLKMRAR